MYILLSLLIKRLLLNINNDPDQILQILKWQTPKLTGDAHFLISFPSRCTLTDMITTPDRVTKNPGDLLKTD